MTEPQDLVTELLAVTDRLVQLVTEETDLLGRPGVPNVAHLAPEKSKLSVRYDMLSQALTKHPTATVHALPDAVRLAQSVRQLGVLAQANGQAITLHMRATRRVIDLVTKAAQKATEPGFSYGRQRMGYGVRSSRNAAIAINQVL